MADEIRRSHSNFNSFRFGSYRINRVVSVTRMLRQGRHRISDMAYLLADSELEEELTDDRSG